MIIGKLFKSKEALARQIVKIVNELQDYWPLTVRQVYYQCVAAQYVENNTKQYDRVKDTLVTLRENDLVLWVAIDDHTRRTTDARGFPDMKTFVDQSARWFLNPDNYERDLVQTQSVYVELMTEKDALASIIEKVAWENYVRLNVGRGQVSATMIHDMSKRFAKARDRGQDCVLIHLGDLDPSGLQIPKSVQNKLLTRHSVEIEVVRAALNPKQVREYKLPTIPHAAKKRDPNYDRWKEFCNQNYPEAAPVELDALHPSALEHIVQCELEKVLDMDAVVKQKKIEVRERKTLLKMRGEILDFAAGKWPQLFKEN